MISSVFHLCSFLYRQFYTSLLGFAQIYQGALDLRQLYILLHKKNIFGIQRIIYPCLIWKCRKNRLNWLNITIKVFCNFEQDFKQSRTNQGMYFYLPASKVFSFGSFHLFFLFPFSLQIFIDLTFRSVCGITACMIIEDRL